MRTFDDIIFLSNCSRFVTYDFGHIASAFGRSATRARAFITDECEPEYERVAAPGVEFQSLPLRRTRMRVRDALKTLRQVRRLAADHEDALFVVFSGLGLVLFSGPLWFYGRRTVYFVTGMGTVFASEKLSYRLVRSVVKRLYRRCFSADNAQVIVQNAEDLEELVRDIGVPRAKLTLIRGCGADPREFPYFPHFVPKPRKVILVPARLIAEKGVREAIHASRILTQRGVPHEMWFTGFVDRGNPLSVGHDELKALAKDSPDVRVLGWQPEILPLLEQCDVVCLPTYYREGLPKTLVEASACGRPIVTTDWVGPREIVEHESSGLLVPVRDAVALAGALERVLTEDGLGERLRREAYRRFLAHHTRTENLRQSLSVFQRLGDLRVDWPAQRDGVELV